MTATEFEAARLNDMTLGQLFRDARTANAFTDRPVDEAEIRAIYELVKWGPTAFNQQPLRAVLVSSPLARARLVPLMDQGNQDKTGSAPAVLILAASNDFHERLPDQFPFFPQAKDAFYSDPEVRAGSAVLNAALQIAYLIIGVRAFGLAAGPMTGFDAEAVASAFFPGENCRPLVVMNIGEPGVDAWYPRGPRLAFDEVVRVA